MGGEENAEDIRRLLRGWLDAAPHPEAAAGSAAAGGIDVPAAEAAAVVEAARAELGLTPEEAAGPRALSGLDDRRLAEVRLLAQTLVVDEHPSAAHWTPLDRRRVVAWTALLIERQGEDGVERLLERLRNTPGDHPVN
ncbi:hypothetical protein [Streptomyces sp. NPDC058548]|uniref:hypothetical protein n=1 Tax=unclassified Streptomyces TaxID=2593676 RepID=UPI00365E7B80